MRLLVCWTCSYLEKRTVQMKNNSVTQMNGQEAALYVNWAHFTLYRELKDKMARKTQETHFNVLLLSFILGTWKHVVKITCYIFPPFICFHAGIKVGSIVSKNYMLEGYRFGFQQIIS